LFARYALFLFMFQLFGEGKEIGVENRIYPVQKRGKEWRIKTTKYVDIKKAPALG
jgi:hypothetical protein